MKEIFSALETVFGSKFIEKNGNYYYDDIKLILPLELPSLSSINDDNYIYCQKKDLMEFLLKKLDFPFENTVENSKISIEFTELSNELCLFLLQHLAKLKTRLLLSSIRIHRLLEVDNNEIDLFHLLRIALSEYCSLTIIIKDEINLSTVVDIVKAHLFNCSMLANLNCCLVEKKDMELCSTLQKGIFTKRTIPDPPHKKYNDEMIQYYIEANITRVPKTRFLSYYNVLEYCASAINEKKRCEEIRDIVTDPSFKQSRVAEYKKIIKFFYDKNIFKEDQSLYDLFSAYLDKDKLLAFLEANKYYSENGAHLIRDSKLIMDNPSLLKILTKRIYGLRNALVYSKEGNDIKFTPIKDDIYIKKEIPLIKFLAEQIIINYATTIDY